MKVAAVCDLDFARGRRRRSEELPPSLDRP
jgi:hypothetical protein